MLKYEQSFVQVEANVPIYKKVSRILGRSGWSIDGTPIDPKIPMDITAQSFVGQGVYRKIGDDEIEYIVSIESGFPRLEKSSCKKDGKLIEKLDKIHVDEVKHFEKGIGMLTGKVSTDNDIDSQADIIFDTEGKSIFAQKNVEANLHAINDITIKGNVYGSSDSHIFHKNHQKLGLVRKGQIVSENGDITIHGHANNTYLEAKNGTVKVSNVTNSIIFGKRVEIDKGVSNCIIVAEEIVSNGKMYGCSLISMKSVDLAQSTEKGDFENTISLFSLDLSESLQKKEQECQK